MLFRRRGDASCTYIHVRIHLNEKCVVIMYVVYTLCLMGILYACGKGIYWSTRLPYIHTEYGVPFVSKRFPRYENYFEA